MSMRGVFVAALLIVFAIAAPANPVVAQTQDGVMKSKTAAEKKADYAARKAAKEAAKAERAAARKAKSDEKKAKAEEKKAAKAEKKGKSTSDRSTAKAPQKQCGGEWKEKRAAGKVEKHMTWPQYYSACNKRLNEKAA